eukprot:TRINITY_DN5197_c0_g1_i1.p1 TRINITY_DN5197_c0_g1~~TRINITY_DN5197_c0_g1_i1.p1  ORF type:complete len:184 (-),score=30.93 TRINITY_DN5197_c0_g1_i1:694-1245(-)
MAACLMQQGNKGPMRDLDYINPRPPRASSALPPEVRAKLLGKRAGSQPPAENGTEAKVFYMGAANAPPKVGQSGAGTNWQNPNGHAFIRRGSGIPMSQRASRKAQMENLGGKLIAMQSEPVAGGQQRPGSRERAPSRERQVRSLHRSNSVSRTSPEGSESGGGYAARTASKDGSASRPPLAPQ